MENFTKKIQILITDIEGFNKINKEVSEIARLLNIDHNPLSVCIFDLASRADHINIQPDYNYRLSLRVEIVYESGTVIYGGINCQLSQKTSGEIYKVFNDLPVIGEDRDQIFRNMQKNFVFTVNT